MKLTCTLTGTSPDYGTVYVDENMNLIHAPAEADAEDTLHLENGILSVETEGNEYQLNDNVLGVVRNMGLHRRPGEAGGVQVRQ